VFAVVGGGWGNFSRAQKPQSARVIVMPRGSALGGFSNPGAMRTPNTLNGPVLSQPVTVQPPQAKAPALPAQKPNRRAPSTATSKATVQPDAPLAK